MLQSRASFPSRQVLPVPFRASSAARGRRSGVSVGPARGLQGCLLEVPGCLSAVQIELTAPALPAHLGPSRQRPVDPRASAPLPNHEPPQLTPARELAQAGPALGCPGRKAIAAKKFGGAFPCQTTDRPRSRPSRPPNASSTSIITSPIATSTRPHRAGALPPNERSAQRFAIDT